MYGVSDASLTWYHRIKAFVLTNRGKVSEIDLPMFTRHEKNSLNGVITVYVDDFLFAGNEKFQNTVIANLWQTFAIGKEESKQFKYLGLNLCYQEDTITKDQKEYITNLECVNIECHLTYNLSELLSNDIKDILKQKVSQLLWVCNQSRPDIYFHVSNIATNIKNGTTKHWLMSTKKSTKRKQISMI